MMYCIRPVPVDRDDLDGRDGDAVEVVEQDSMRTVAVGCLVADYQPGGEPNLPCSCGVRFVGTVVGDG